LEAGKQAHDAGTAGTIEHRQADNQMSGCQQSYIPEHSDTEGNMSNDRTRGDYDELKSIQSKWQQEAEAIDQMNANLASCLQTLEGGDWIGQGARAFFAEMNSQVMPSLKRLNKALASAAKNTNSIAREIKSAEEASSSMLNGSILF
jgi:WXG100 family type VII secretion target